MGRADRDIFAWIGDAWDAAIDWIDTPLAWIFNWLADGIEGVFDWVEDAWTGVLDWFDGPGQDESVWSWLGEGIAGPFRWVFTSWAGALDWLSAPARGVFAWLGVPLDNIFGWLEAGWNDALDWLQGPGADQSVFDWLLQGVTGPFLWIYSAWADVTSWISAPFEGVWDWLSDPVDSPFEWVSEAWDKVMKGLTDLIPERLRRFLGIDAEAAEPPDEEAAGFAIPQTLGEGVESGEPGFLGKTEAALKRLRDRLPFSDAKVGPLSDLTASGRSIMSTIAEGIRQGGPAAAHALDDVLRFEALQRLDAPLPVGPAPAAIQALQTEARAETALAAPSTVTLQIDKIEVVVPSGDPHEIAATLADELRDQLRRATEDADSKRIV